MTSILWNAAVVAVVGAILYAAFRHFHVMANSTRLVRLLAAIVIIAVALLLLNSALPATA